MKPLLQSPTPSITASSRVEQSPWETKSMTHSQSDTKPLYTFSFKARGSAAALMSSARLSCEAARVEKQSSLRSRK